MALPLTEAADIELQLTTRRDERLSWPGWLTYSGWLTHISGHPSATGRAQDSESTPAKDRRHTAVRCTTQPTSRRLRIENEVRCTEARLISGALKHRGLKPINPACDRRRPDGRLS